MLLQKHERAPVAQPAGVAQAPAVQRKADLRGMDYAAQVGALAPVQMSPAAGAKPVQMWGMSMPRVDTPAADTKPAADGAAAKGAEPDSAPKSAEPDAAPKSAEPDAAPKGAEPDAAPKGAEPDAASKGAEPDAAPKGAEPDAAPKGAEPAAPKGPSSLEVQARALFAQAGMSLARFSEGYPELELSATLNGSEGAVSRTGDQCLDLLNRGLDWQAQEGDKALESLKKGMGDFLQDAVKTTVGAVIPGYEVAKWVAEIGLSVVDIHQDNKEIDRVRGDFAHVSGALKGMLSRQVAAYLEAMQSLSQPIGRIRGYKDALFSDLGIGDVRREVAAEKAQLEATVAAGETPLPRDVEDARRLRDRAEKFLQAGRALKRDATDVFSATHAAERRLWEVGEAAFDNMLASYIKHRAGNNDVLMHLGDGEFDSTKGAQVRGSCHWTDGAGFRVRLSRGDNVDATRETNTRFDGMTWQDFKKHRIPIVAELETHNTTLYFVQGAGGERSVSGDRSDLKALSRRLPEQTVDKSIDNVWAILDQNSKNQLY